MKVKTLPVSEKSRYQLEKFSNFSVTGSITGMKKLYYGEDALLVRCGSYIYHVGNLNHRLDSPCMTLGESIYFCYAH